MADSYLPYQNPTVTDKKLDSESISVGANTVERERVQISGASALEVAEVKAANPSSSGYGAVVRNIPFVATTGGQGRKTVTSAGTPVVLASTTAAKEVVITALQSNTDIIVVGFTGVVAGSALDSGNTRTGIPLFPNNSVTLRVVDLASIFIDSVVSGEGVSYAYFN